jgi:hypothetical protein
MNFNSNMIIGQIMRGSFSTLAAPRSKSPLGAFLLHFFWRRKRETSALTSNALP